jgi:hypothetical protein
LLGSAVARYPPCAPDQVIETHGPLVSAQSIRDVRAREVFVENAFDVFRTAYPVVGHISRMPAMVGDRSREPLDGATRSNQPDQQIDVFALAERGVEPADSFYPLPAQHHRRQIRRFQAYTGIQVELRCFTPRLFDRQLLAVGGNMHEAALDRTRCRLSGKHGE